MTAPFRWPWSTELCFIQVRTIYSWNRTGGKNRARSCITWVHVFSRTVITVHRAFIVCFWNEYVTVVLNWGLMPPKLVGDVALQDDSATGFRWPVPQIATHKLFWFIYSEHSSALILAPLNDGFTLYWFNHSLVMICCQWRLPLNPWLSSCTASLHVTLR